MSQEFKEYALFTPLTKMELKTDDKEVELILMGTGYSMASARVTAGAIKCFLEVYGVKSLNFYCIYYANAAGLLSKVRIEEFHSDGASGNYL